MKDDERIQQPVDLGLNEGKIESGDSCFTYKIKPKADLGSLLKGDFENDDVQIVVTVNSNLAAILDSPKGTKKFDATICATKKF